MFKFVQHTQLDQFHAEMVQAMAEMEAMNAEVKRTVQKQADIGKLVRTLEKRGAAHQKKLDDQKEINSKIQKELKNKTDLEDFDEQIRSLTGVIATVSAPGAKAPSLNIARPAPKSKTGGLTKKDRETIDKVTERSDKQDQFIRILQA
jgi:hypothetical protein